MKKTKTQNHKETKQNPHSPKPNQLTNQPTNPEKDKNQMRFLCGMLLTQTIPFSEHD